MDPCIRSRSQLIIPRKMDAEETDSIILRLNSVCRSFNFSHLIDFVLKIRYNNFKQEKGGTPWKITQIC